MAVENLKGTPLTLEECFQVDRDKLEKLMSENTQGRSNADIFFEKIMISTQTYIQYPRSILGDISMKKHPYVRVVGQRIEDITWAKGLILASLEVNNSICKLKMCFSNVDHQFTLGRNNINVHRIIDITKAIIVFPDPHMIKKGNQITITGALDQLERARQELRLYAPVVMTFEIPTIRTIPPPERIAGTFKVQVIYRANNNTSTLSVMIRSTARKVDSVIRATQSLLDYSMGRMGVHGIVNVLLEVPTLQQELVKGENCENVLSIMEHTNTRIYFPDFSQKVNRKSQVTITGGIYEALKARDELIGCFPIELTFDISPEEQDNATAIMELGRKEGVCITLSHKERDSGMSVTVKGPERFTEKIYQFQRQVRQIKNNMMNTVSPFGFKETDSGIESPVENIESTNIECFSGPIQYISDENLKEEEASIFPISEEQILGDWINLENSSVNSMISSQADYEIERVLFYPPHPDYEDGFCFLQPDLVTCDSVQSDLVQEAIQPNPEFNTFPQPQHAHIQNCPPTNNSPAIYQNVAVQEFTNDCPQINNHPQMNYENLYVPSAPVDASPLIVGSDKSVAERLIVKGWGNIF